MSNIILNCSFILPNLNNVDTHIMQYICVLLLCYIMARWDLLKTKISKVVLYLVVDDNTSSFGNI